MSHFLVIGSGVAGLMASTILLKKNHTVTIMEARDRIGGRIHTLLTKFSRPVEAGAEFMHGKLPLTLSLLKQAGSESILVKGQRYTLSKGEMEKGELMDDQWKAFSRELKKLKVDTDLATFLQHNFRGEAFMDLREGIKRFAEGFDIADINRVSVLALRDEWLNSDEEHQYRIEGGYQTLVNYLQKKVRDAGGTIFLSSPVHEIHWDSGQAKAMTDRGTFEGDKIIITVPLGVLQKGAIRFSPALPQQQKAFHSIGFGGVIKFLFEFKQPFWEEVTNRPLRNLSFLFSDAEVPTWWTQFPDKKTFLTGWLGGPRSFVSHDPEMLYNKAMRSLEYAFKCSRSDIQSAIIHWHIADWVEDPHSYGAYTYPTLETSRAKKLLSDAIQDTVYFAGEALYEGTAMGTVEAALVNGKEVAERIGNG